MAFAGDGHPTRNIPEMGSLLYLPLTMSGTTGCWLRWRNEWMTTT
jgi:hypothetical protein